MTPQEILYKTCKYIELGITESEAIEAMKLYATEKVKEALKLAADSVMMSWQYFPNEDPSPYIDKNSILDLEIELLNQINKEI